MLIGIFGSGRNGSTLITRLLDSSPHLWVHPAEVNYLCVFSDLLRFSTVRARTVQNAVCGRLDLDYPVSSKLLVPIFQAHIDEIEHCYNNNCYEPVVVGSNPISPMLQTERFSARDFFLEFIGRVRKGYDTRPGNPILAFKSGETPYIRDYLRTFPEMRCIHIIRNPITNYASFKRTNFVRNGRPFWYLGGDLLQTFLEKRWLPHARFLAEHVGAKDPRHIVLRYEDLCQAPEAELSRICSWLGVDVPTLPGELTVLGGRRVRALPDNPSAKGVQTPTRVEKDMASRFGYSNVVSERERDFILHRTRDLASRLGYALPAPDRGALRLAVRWIAPDASESANIFGAPQCRNPVLDVVYTLGLHAARLLARRAYILRALAGSPRNG